MSTVNKNLTDMNLHLLTQTSDQYHGADLINISLRNAATRPLLFFCAGQISY